MTDQRRDDRRPNSPRDSRDSRGPRGPRDPRDVRDFRGGGGRSAGPASASSSAPVPAAIVKSGVPHGAREGGWLPDCVYTGEKFEFGLAFFADALGRVTRFSREPADLAAARRLAGQAALPGLVNAHSHSFLRLLRGRTEQRGREPVAIPKQNLLARLSGEDVFDVARMTFMEM